ncbi:hypothetical protein D3C75_857270 [compost metagenome]
MGGVGSQHPAEALYILVIGGEIDLQLIHPLEIKFYAAQAAVDLKGIRRAVSCCEPCSFEAAERPVRETGQEQGGIIHRHRSPGGVFTRLGAESGHFRRKRAFLNEGLAHADHFLYITDQIMGQVDKMCAEIAMRA